MAPKTKPDAKDTEPPEEVRPDTCTTATPLLVEDRKLLAPEVKRAVEFTTEPLLRWLEGLADKHKKNKLRERYLKQEAVACWCLI
jgi:hypothetical protein